jgi:hypothetical protein
MGIAAGYEVACWGGISWKELRGVMNGDKLMTNQTGGAELHATRFL